MRMFKSAHGLRLTPIRSWTVIHNILEAEGRGLSRTRVFQIASNAEQKLIHKIKRDPILCRYAKDFIREDHR